MLRTLGTRSRNADVLTHARQILRAEANALKTVADRLDDSFVNVVERLDACAGRIAVTGVGKSEDVGRKMVGTFNSTGTRAYFLNATNALHGDLGMVHPDDAAVVLSHSGESEEIVRLLPSLRGACAGIVALTGNGRSTLALVADAAIVYGPLTETCPLNLAPSTSTTVMLALGDALAFTLSEKRGLTAEQFARHHPAGSLGRQLANVETYMRKGSALRVASSDDTIRDVFAQAGRRGRRTGAILLIDRDHRLCGIFTDSDLARLFERRADEYLDRPICDMMTRNPRTVAIGTKMGAAIEILKEHKISELPVVDGEGRPVGVVDITDLLDLMPAADISAEDAGERGRRIRRSA
jgi:arabinose-5-phosphate isomerase